MEALTRESLEAARRLWVERGPSSYSVAYELNHSQYEVSVQDGIVTNVQVDGVRPVGAAWSHYSIEGLFELLDMEIENLEDPVGPFAGSRATVFAKIRFDESLGYPVYYLRSGGGVPPASIRVIAFEPIEP